jgi:ABC-type multidrug transport system ATPase subunit
MLRKNAVLMRRNRRDLAREILLPVVYLAALIVLREAVRDVLIPAATYSSIQLAQFTDEALTDATQLAGTSASRPLLISFAGPSCTADALFVKVMAFFAAKAKAAPLPFTVRCFDSPSALEIDAIESGRHHVGFIFPQDGIPAAASLQNTLLTYTIRCNRTVAGSAAVPAAAGLFSLDRSSPSASVDADDAVDLPSAARRAAEAALVAAWGGETSNAFAALDVWSVRSERMLNPAHVEGTASGMLSFAVPGYLTVIFMMQLRTLLARILEEKEKKIKVGLKMVGLSDAVYWVSFFLTAATKTVLLISVSTFVLWYGGLLEGVAVELAFVLFALFGAACILYSFAITAFFSHARDGAVVGFFLFLVAALPAHITTGLAVGGVGALPPALALALCALPPTAFGYGMVLIVGAAEPGRDKIGWSNAFETSAGTPPLSFGAVVAILFVDNVALLVLASYLNAVVRNDSDSTLPWWFCVDARWWRRCAVRALALRSAAPPLALRVDESGALVAERGDDVDGQRRARGGRKGERGAASVPLVNLVAGDSDGSALLALRSTLPVVSPRSDAAAAARSDACEALPPGARVGVQIRSLSKFYGSETAVDDVSVNFAAGEITALLGRNGAGKTTLVGMLTGVVPPSGEHGDALIYGRSVRDDIAGVRRLLGVCPQHDVLFSKLTVREHLVLAAAIKRVPASRARACVDEAVASVGLSAKAHAQAATLSGGQKRALSVAVALMGDPKVVFLDEPSTGMDPVARRSLWALLERMKRDRVIVLTTHYMDEADILADRIAVLAEGRLHAVGTPYSLKQRFGCGYRLSLTRLRSAPRAEVHAIVTSAVPNATRVAALASRASAEDCGAEGDFETESGGAAAADDDDAAWSQDEYRLPYDDAAQFPTLCRALDALGERADGGGSAAVRYTLSTASLSDVFLNATSCAVSSEGDALESRLADGALLRGASAYATVPGEGHDDDAYDLRPNCAQQLVGLLLKRFHWARRDRRASLLQFACPLIGVCAGVAIMAFELHSATSMTSVASLATVSLDHVASRGAAVVALPVAASAADAESAALLRSAVNGAAMGVDAVDWDGTAALASFGGNALGAIRLGPVVDGGRRVVTLLWNSTVRGSLAAVVGAANSALARTDGARSTPSGGVLAGLRAFDCELSPFPLAPGQFDLAAGMALYTSTSVGAMYIAMAVGVGASLQAAHAVHERELGLYAMQITSGVAPHLYWLALVLADCVFVAPTLIATYVLVCTLCVDAIGAAGFVALAVLLACYGAANASVAYLLAAPFEKRSTARTWVSFTISTVTIALWSAGAGINFPFANDIIEHAGGGESPAPATYAWVMTLGYAWPQYALAQGIADIATQTSCRPGYAAPGCAPRR